MKRHIFYIIIASLFLVSFFYISNIRQVNADNVAVLSSSNFVDSIGNYHVVGEVQNTGLSTVDFAKITATFYDSSNKVVDTDFTYTELSYLQPNAKSPFDLIDIQTTIVPLIDHYSLGLSSSPSGSIQQALQILSDSSYTDSVGYYHVVGEIQNQGAATSSFTKVCATFYDSSRKVVDADFTYTNPSDVASGAKAPFEIMIVDSSRVPLISSYSLTAQSNTYALISASSAVTATPTPTTASQSTQPPSASPTTIVPEFPSLTVLTILIIMSLFTAIVGKQKIS